MFASALIIGLSAVLLAYWFRYSCILLLRDRAAETVAVEINSQANVTQVRRDIPSANDLAPLEKALQRDYALLVYLFEHTSGLELKSIEDRMLVWDYKLMRSWYHLTKAIFPSRSRKALDEMASVLDVLFRRIGRQARAYTRA